MLSLTKWNQSNLLCLVAMKNAATGKHRLILVVNILMPTAW
jgi:hypothetical protein